MLADFNIVMVAAPSKTIASKEVGILVDVDERFCKLSIRLDFAIFYFVTKKAGSPDFHA